MSSRKAWIPLLALMVLAGCSESEASSKGNSSAAALVQATAPEDAVPEASGQAPAVAADPVAAPAMTGSVKWPPARLTVVGALPSKVVAEVFAAHAAEIRSCYEKPLRRNPRLAGELRLEWTVRPDGRVAVVKAKHNTLGAPAVQLCLMSKVKRWEFLEPSHGRVIVGQTFVFSAGN